MTFFSVRDQGGYYTILQTKHIHAVRETVDINFNGITIYFDNGRPCVRTDTDDLEGFARHVLCKEPDTPLNILALAKDG